MAVGELGDFAGGEDALAVGLVADVPFDDEG